MRLCTVLAVGALVACSSAPPTDAEVPGWTRAQFDEYVRQRPLVVLMRRNDPGLAAAIRQQAGSDSEVARVTASVRATMLAEDDREAEARCQAHLQPIVAPAIIAVAVGLAMKADRDACVQQFRATGATPNPVPRYRPGETGVGSGTAP